MISLFFACFFSRLSREEGKEIACLFSLSLLETIRRLLVVLLNKQNSRAKKANDDDTRTKGRTKSNDAEDRGERAFNMETYYYIEFIMSRMSRSTDHWANRETERYTYTREYER